MNKKWVIVLVVLGLIIIAVLASKAFGKGLGGREKELKKERKTLIKEIAELEAKVQNDFPGSANDVIDLEIKKKRLSQINNELAGTL